MSQKYEKQYKAFDDQFSHLWASRSLAVLTANNQRMPIDIIDKIFIPPLPAGYGKTVMHVVIGLKTAKGTKQLKLDPSIYESLQKEKVEVGDVIYIEANSGAVKVSYIPYLYIHLIGSWKGVDLSTNLSQWILPYQLGI